MNQWASFCLSLAFPPFFIPFQTVTSDNETLRKRVESVVEMALTTVSSLSEMYSGSATSAVNDIAIKPVGNALGAGASEDDPTLTKDSEETEEMSEEAEA